MTAELTRGDILRALDASLLPITLAFAAVGAGATVEVSPNFTTLTQRIWIYVLHNSSLFDQPYALELRQQAGATVGDLIWRVDLVPSSYNIAWRWPDGMYYIDLDNLNQVHMALTNRGSSALTGTFTMRYRPAIIDG